MSFSNLWTWRKHLKRSFDYTGVIAETRAKGLWPEARRGGMRFSDRRTLVARRDRLGDTMLSIPIFERLRAAGADVRALLFDAPSRALLTGVGIECAASVEELGDWEPDGVLFLERCRHLRSARHPERWPFVETILAAFAGIPCAIPTMRRAEAMSIFPGSYCTPFAELTALSLLERFADGLGLPEANEPLFGHWIGSDATRATGRVVINLSAGVAGECGRRHVPIEIWTPVVRALAVSAPVAFIVAPGDDARREQVEALIRRGDLPDCEIHCFEDISRGAEWLGAQRVLLSPETGLCHLARNLRLPMVVLTPRRQIPYWYQRTPDARYVFAERLEHASPRETVAAAESLLARSAPAT